jgi:hypothetical protein
MCRITLFFAVILSLALCLCIVACDPEKSPVGSPGAGIRWDFIKVSGDGQSTVYLDTLSERMVVRLTDLLGVGIKDREISFSVIAGQGQLQKPATANKILEYVVPTDFEGYASAQFLNQVSDTNVTSQIKATVVDSTQFFVTFTVSTSP